MIAAFVHMIGANKRKERIAVDDGSFNPIVHQQKMSLLSVPHAIYVRVLGLLSLRDVVLLDSALVNRSWRNRFHRTLDGFVLPGRVNYFCVKWFEARKCFMDKLVVTSHVKNAAGISTLSRISELHLRGAAHVSAVDLLALLTTCSKLEKLSLSKYNRLHQLKFDAISTPLSLLTLYLTSNYHINDVSVVALLKKCPHLQVLHANDCAKLTELVVRGAAQYCPDLREIHFNYQIKRMMDLEALRRQPDPPVDIIYDSNSCYCELFRSCTQLQIVDFSVREYGTGGNITPLDVLTLAQHCTRLTHVSLSSPVFLYTQRDDTDLLDNALVQLVQNNPLIVSLTLKDFHRVTDVALNAIALHLPNLHTFRLKGCGWGNSSQNEGHHNIRRACEKLTVFESNLAPCLSGTLQTLQLNKHKLMDDVELVRIAQCNYNVQTFRHRADMYSSSLVTNTGLSVALSHWHHLHTFDVTGDYDLSAMYRLQGVASKAPVVDDSVLYTLVQHCPLLTSLNVSGNTQLSNEALSTIGRLINLKHLVANMCKLLGDSALAAIALGCTELIHIELGYCEISDIGIGTLALYGSHKLRHISLTACKHLHNSGIQKLIRASRQLRYLKLNYFEKTHVSFSAVSELPLYCPFMEILSCSRYMHYSFHWAYRKHKQYFDTIMPKHVGILYYDCFAF